MRALLFAAMLFLCSPLRAVEPQLQRDVPYAEPKSERQTLDIYTTGEGKNRPILFWIHGGGWRQGDKRGVQKKPAAFGEKGFVFVSTNYRFYPDVTIKEMMGDIAKAIRWTHDHATDFGGDPNSIIVMGHSAGAYRTILKQGTRRQAAHTASRCAGCQCAWAAFDPGCSGTITETVSRARILCVGSATSTRNLCSPGFSPTTMMGSPLVWAHVPGRSSTVTCRWPTRGDTSVAPCPKTGMIRVFSVRYWRMTTPRASGSGRAG